MRSHLSVQIRVLEPFTVAKLAAHDLTLGIVLVSLAIESHKLVKVGDLGHSKRLQSCGETEKKKDRQHKNRMPLP